MASRTKTYSSFCHASRSSSAEKHQAQEGFQ